VAARKLLCILAVALFLSCTSYKDLAKERARRAETAKGDISVAVVLNTPFRETLFDEGIEMAVTEINARGGILGRRLWMAMHPNVPRDKEQKIARTIAADANIVAVIGHLESDGAIPVSVTYQEAGLLFISTGATSPSLTDHGFPYVFRNIPSDSETGKVLAKFCVTKGFRNMVMIDDESEYGVTLTNIFVEKAAAAGIKILLRRSYFPWQTDFRSMLHDIKDQGADAIFLGADVPKAAEVIKQARQMGIKIPFIGGDGLDTDDLWKIAGNAAEDTIISTIFNPTDADPNTQLFSENFLKRYGTLPDMWAALGYDAVSLLDTTYTKAGSTAPIVAASFLRFIADRQSVMGIYSFTKTGDITDKKFYFKVFRDGKFEYLPERIEGN
jgi:branched-chain amino acid transport system substrate-binding protein